MLLGLVLGLVLGLGLGIGLVVLAVLAVCLGGTEVFESTLLDVFCGPFVVIFVPASNLAWVVVASVRAELALARRQATR